MDHLPLIANTPPSPKEEWECRLIMKSYHGVAIFIKKELLLLIIGGIFVWEAISVILQVFFFRFTGKRVFLMAPFHHHLQLKGWSESKVTIRFWIIAFILAVIGLGTLKIR